MDSVPLRTKSSHVGRFDSDDLDSPQLRIKPQQHRVFHFLLLAQAIFLLIFGYLLFQVRAFSALTTSNAHLSNFESPAAGAIEYQLRYFSKYSYVASDFAQKPGPVVDRAWHNLLKGMNIKVSGEYLLPYHAKSVRLSDGTGYAAQLGVYHELHCLKKIQQWIHRSHYYSNISATAATETEAHVEHCLEWIRLGVLCRSDTTLSVLQWDSPTQSRLETEYPIPRTCVNSEKIFDWAEKNAIDLNKEGLVERP